MMKVKRMSDHIIILNTLWLVQALILFIMSIVNLFLHSYIIQIIFWTGELFLMSNYLTYLLVGMHNNKILNDIIKKYREENNRLIKEVFHEIDLKLDNIEIKND